VALRSHGGSETILVVEDEVAVRRVTRQHLQQLGYTVLEASRGEEAIAIAAEFPGPIHLLLTDIVLPGMKGPELARQLRLTRPATRVLYVSGYLGDSMGPLGLLPENIDLLSKPFSTAALGEKVREVLGPAGS
jgi:CheY-like chemotaxis protein